MSEAATIEVRGLNFQYPHQAKGGPCLSNVSFSIPPGSRVLLVGSNGAGKTTLLKILGGRHMVHEDCVRVLGRPAFHDVSLNDRVALLTGTWVRDIAFTAHSVPLQGDVSARKLIANHATGVSPERVEKVVKLLGVNPNWNMQTASDGERRRTQIMVKLLREWDVLLLDEVTTDLDILARANLLTFLTEESSRRGATVVYATHIFDGIDLWPTHILHLQGGQVKRFLPFSDLKLVPSENALVRMQNGSAGLPEGVCSGFVFRVVREWMLAERQEELEGGNETTAQ